MERLQKVYTDDKDLTQVQQNVAHVLDDFYGNPFAHARMVRNVAFTSGSDTSINHGLGRPVQDWMVISLTGFAQFRISPTTNNAADRKLTLLSNADVTGSVVLW